MSAKETRLEIGGDILISMAANDEFPIANKHRLAKTMQEYFVTEGSEDVLVEMGYSWRPDVDYWTRHLGEIRKYLRENRRLFLQFVRDHEDGPFTGTWQFTRKGDYQRVMDERRAELETRIDNYNEEVGAGHSNPKWKRLDIPYVNHTLQIPEKMNAG